MRHFMNSYMLHVRGIEHSKVLHAIFAPMSLAVGAVNAVSDFLRGHGLIRTVEPPIPLISVGNLTYGGTNKTPFAAMLARYAEERGVKAGIVTRGYSGTSDGVTIVMNGNCERELVGDEPLLLSREMPDIPVAVAKQRIDGVMALSSAGVELAIADDAFQHKSLGRDVDIVLIDAMCPFGNKCLIPAGIMRENISALSRADIVVLTKSEQVTPDELAKLKDCVAEFVPADRIFTSRLEFSGWTGAQPTEGAKVFAFSAIGNPESFRMSLQGKGFTVTGHKSFRDHHRYTLQDLEDLCSLAEGADFMACTEKDLYNLPPQDTWPFKLPLAVPHVKTVLNEPDKFFALLASCLRPKIVVASNGYGEDAIGVTLAQKLRDRLPCSQISAFPLVGKGDAYVQAGFEVACAPSVTPSGGVLKYSLRDLWGDMRAGLLKHVRAQLADWRKIAHSLRTPICVGDVYLLLHTLWGSGKWPLFCATAKTVYLSGHWRLERSIIRRFTLRTWARDKVSAHQLGDGAIYSGSPVMDLLGTHKRVDGDVILLLPGSRMRACNDVKLLLDAAEILSAEGENSFRMVLAPTLPDEEFLSACEGYGWNANNECLTHGAVNIPLTHNSIASSAEGVKLLLGFGGTANQLCAGLGIPVISVDEKGKRVQKKLLGDAEILTAPDGGALAQCALKVLRDPELYAAMSNAGRERMGAPGACEAIVEYVCDVLGWTVREKVFTKLC